MNKNQNDQQKLIAACASAARQDGGRCDQPEARGEKWLARVRAVEQAFDRAGIWCARGVGRLAVVIVPSILGKPSRWVANVQGPSDGRYVIRVKCRRCGHCLRTNQVAWRIRHEMKCEARS